MREVDEEDLSKVPAGGGASEANMAVVIGPFADAPPAAAVVDAPDPVSLAVALGGGTTFASSIVAAAAAAAAPLFLKLSFHFKGFFVTGTGTWAFLFAVSFLLAATTSILLLSLSPPFKFGFKTGTPPGSIGLLSTAEGTAYTGPVTGSYLCEEGNDNVEAFLFELAPFVDDMDDLVVSFDDDVGVVALVTGAGA